jgi:glyoxylase-like metal-dependent hydrolase (beta-lactamase superfamily II)
MITDQTETKKPEGKHWLSAKLVAEKTWCIDDHGGDNMYLVEGEDKALLIDTGNGYADLKTFMMNLTKLPVLVVNTHGHPDHVGGNFQFEQVYAHAIDFDLIGKFSGEAFHKDAVKRAMAENPDFISSFIKNNGEDYNLPELIPIEAGYVFDLGNRKLEIIEVPGHTLGSIVLLDSVNKLLFTGDNNNTVVWLFLDGCLPVEGYMQTLQKLNQRKSEFDTILPGHGEPLDNAIIDELILCAQGIVKGDCESEPYESFMGTQRKCSYKRVSIAFNPENIRYKIK